jgi:hypothetical protein
MAVSYQMQMILHFADAARVMCRDQSSDDVGCTNEGALQVLALVAEFPELLLEVDGKHRNLLHYACMTKNLTLVKALYRPALAWAEDYKTALPIHYAAKFGTSAILSFLKEKDPNQLLQDWRLYDLTCTAILVGNEDALEFRSEN